MTDSEYKIYLKNVMKENYVSEVEKVQAGILIDDELREEIDNDIREFLEDI